MTTTINASNSGSGGLIQTADASGVLALQTAGTTAVTIDASQNVGIGGGTPGSNPKVSLYGGIRFLANEAASATYTGIGSVVADQVSISCAGTERVRVDNGGNIKLTTASTAIQNSSGRPILNQTGSILQVVQTAKTDTFSTAAGTGSPATITGLSGSITPSSTSNKVLVLVNFGQISGSADTTFGIFMFRNATKIDAGDAAGSRAVGSIAGGIASSGGTWRGFSGSIMFLDSPASTSSVSYTFSLGGNGSATVYLNQDGRNNDVANDSTRTPITVILMEIAA